MAEQCACKSMTTLNRDAVPIGDDIESVGESCVNVETGFEEEEEEEEESLESEIPTVGTNLKNPMSRSEQERQDCGHVVYRNWCAACVEARGVEGQPQVEPLEEEERKRTTPRGF